MTIHTQRISPDTCGCSHDYELDTDTGALVCIGTHVVCSEHARLGLAGLAAGDAAIADVRRKNAALRVIGELHPDQDLDAITHHWDAARRLTLRGHDPDKHESILAALALRFPDGSVGLGR